MNNDSPSKYPLPEQAYYRLISPSTRILFSYLGSLASITSVWVSFKLLNVLI